MLLLRLYMGVWGEADTIESSCCLSLKPCSAATLAFVAEQAAQSRLSADKSNLGAPTSRNKLQFQYPRASLHAGVHRAAPAATSDRQGLPRGP